MLLLLSLLLLHCYYGCGSGGSCSRTCCYPAAAAAAAAAAKAVATVRHLPTVSMKLFFFSPQQAQSPPFSPDEIEVLLAEHDWNDDDDYWLQRKRPLNLNLYLILAIYFNQVTIKDESKSKPRTEILPLQSGNQE